MSRDPDAPFSRRFGYCRDLDVEITIREDAPEWFRDWLQPASEDAGMNAVELRQVTRRLLPEMPEFRNLFPKLEASAALDRCEWYLVYDVAEAIYAALRRRQVRPEGPATVFEERLNKLFRERGVGWQMRNGRMEFRGSELFNVVTREASEVLAGHGRQTAAREIHEALQDLSRRPEPDLTGAVHHAMAALECVARKVSGEGGATLGQIIKQHPEALGLPPPLDQALSKLWGYASEQGRHLREGREPGLQETELVVSIAAAVSVYLSKRGSPSTMT